MVEQLLATIASWVIYIISTLGYPGIVLTMAIESALVPLPSEIIMPFSGFLVSTGRFTIWAVAVAGAIGNLLGSLLAYALGYWGHERIVRRFIRRFGKFILLTEKDLDLAEKYFNQYGGWIVLISRVTPAVRTYISLPAGIARYPIFKFSIYTFFGALIWSWLLAYVGFLLGENWHSIGPVFRKFDIIIVLVFIIVIGLYLYHKLKPVFSNQGGSSDREN